MLRVRAGQVPAGLEPAGLHVLSERLHGRKLLVHALRGWLHRPRPELDHVLPSVPERALVRRRHRKTSSKCNGVQKGSNMDTDFVKRRCKALHIYINKIARHPIVGVKRCFATQIFLASNEEGFQAAKELINNSISSTPNSSVRFFLKAVDHKF